jgi:PAS domain S-box-containing protein
MRSAKALKIENHYQVLFEQSSDPTMIIEANGAVEEVNGSLEELTGYLANELIGKKFSILIQGQGKKEKLPPRIRPLSLELLFAEGTYEEIGFFKKDGTLQLADISVRKIKSGEKQSKKTLALVVFRDVTERKRMERELITKHNELKNAYHELEKSNLELKAMQDTLIQSGKMAALGELAAGIAHELNQPLQGIKGYAQELEQILGTQKIEDAQIVNSSLHEITSNVDKMAKIIQYLRVFTRKSTEEHEFTDVHSAIEEALKMLARQFSARGIVVHKNFSDDLPKVYANPLQLEQVFINLSTNARDAIEANGRGSGNIWIESKRDEKFVEIIYKDDGCGMSTSTKSKSMNPFFTTKEVGKGMGLGLSLSYGILNKIHGSIVVESELGKGARFTIRLPIDFRNE